MLYVDIYQGLISLNRNFQEALNMLNHASKDNTTLFFLLCVPFRTLVAATVATLFPTYTYFFYKKPVYKKLEAGTP